MSGELDHAIPPRARRFDLAFAVHYRRHGDRAWAEAVSVNVSRSGLLFATREAAPSCGECIDFLIHLTTAEGKPASDARCTGHVVRVVPPGTDRDTAAVGATIDRYLLERHSRRSKRLARHGARPDPSR